MIFLDEHQKKIFTNIFTEGMDKKISELLNLYELDKWEDFLSDEKSNQITSQRASHLSPLVDLVIKNTANKMKLNWKFDAGVGYDSIFNDIEIEHKFSLSDGNTWTGHSYSNKVPDHLLVKLGIKKDKISDLFIGFVKFGKNLNYSNTNGNTNSFSTIKIHVNDIYDLIVGDVIPKRIWCGIYKYPIRKEI